MSTQKTAVQTYAAHRHDIARLLDVLQMELERLDADAKASPNDWGSPATSRRSGPTSSTPSPS